MAIIGKKIKAKREECGLTRKQLSEKSGVPLRTISQWEETERMYRCDMVLIMKIVLAMDCSLQDIVEDGQELRIRNKKDTHNYSVT